MRLRTLACCGGIAVGLTAILATPGCDAASQVRQVYLALDGQGLRVRNEFFTDTASIFCDVVWSGRGTDNSVQAVFTQTAGEMTLFDGTGTDPSKWTPVNRQWGAAEQNPPAGVATLSFELPTFSNLENGDPLPYPVGQWTCTLSVNGEEAGSSDFTVLYPPAENGNLNGCPPAYVTSTGNSCAGYIQGAQCPSAAQDNQNTACQCILPDGGGPADRVWLCPNE
jgi:hypothetical protein